MLRTLTRLPATVAILLCFAVVPLALSSDGPQSDEAKANAVLEAEVEKATPAKESDASKAKGDEQATTAVTATEGPATSVDKWVCRKETPTGSHRTITACRRVADIEASSAEVEQVMHRQRHYGNPSVTPQD